MKVKELINKLKEYDEDYDIRLCIYKFDGGNCWTYDINTYEYKDRNVLSIFGDE